MTKIDDAWPRVERFERKLRENKTFTAALLEGYGPPEHSAFTDAVAALSADLRCFLSNAADADDYRERLHDLVMIDGEATAIGGGPGFKERRDKAWRRAREPFEP